MAVRPYDCDVRMPETDHWYSTMVKKIGVLTSSSEATPVRDYSPGGGPG